MILKFPDLDRLRLALLTGAVPATMSQVGAVAGCDEQGHCWVETSATLAKPNLAQLKKLGVLGSRAFGTPDKVEVSCWAEILPLVDDPQPIDNLEHRPVLFDLPGGDELASLVLEMLRLGNDRQSYRWLEDNESGTRALLRVEGPPYYTLLRAKDRIGGERAPVAFLESSPNSRVWVELGYSHPLLGHVKPPAGQILLLRPPRKWTLLDEVPFQDVYEILEFHLPTGKVTWKDAKLEDKLTITPSLKPGGAAEGAELWVLRDNAVEELNRFVQNADDQMLQRLAFAIGEKKGQKTIVVRVRQSKQPPPVLVLANAIAYKHYLKLPNLFLPVGSRLHPPLSRDQVRKLLAEDQSQVVWLHPGKNGDFTPESLPENAFLPLWDWVNYVLDHDKEPLQAWVQATQFDFEAFVSDEEASNKPRKPPAGEGKPKAPRDRGGSRDAPVEFNVAPPEDPTEVEETAPFDDFANVAKAEPSVLEKQLRELEESFLALDGGLDVPRRQEMWPRLAALNTRMQRVDDAGVCWMNALWERGDEATRAWAWSWFTSEAQAVPTQPGKPKSQPRSWVTGVLREDGKLREVPGEDLDRLLALEEPATADLRALAAYLVFAAVQEVPSAVLVQRLGRLSRFLEAHEKLLSVRAVWLAWSHLTLLSRGDVLALARARDRLLERLYHSGLRPEQDLPSFLRFAGQPTSQRFRAVRQWMIDLAEQAQEWLRNGPTPPQTARTAAYVDLIFAFGLARLGESDAARTLLGRARQALHNKDDVHTFLYSAFEYRVRQALDGKPHAGPLPDELVESLEQMDRLLRYIVDRLRKYSIVLEPEQRIDQYRHILARNGELEKALAELADLTDRAEIVRRVEKLLAGVAPGSKGVVSKAMVIRVGLEAAPRVGEDFARKMLDLTVPTYDALPEEKDLQALGEQAAFLERGLFVAGHFGRTEAVHPLVMRFQKMLQGQKGTQVLQTLAKVAAQCFRGLRKLGMRDEIDQLLRQMAELVLQGQDVKAIDFKKYPDNQGPAALLLLLQVASQWYYFGRDSQAEPILQVARTVLRAGDLSAREQTQLACEYARAVGQAPVEVAQKRLEELFTSLKGIKDMYTTSSHLSVLQLEVVESVVLAVVSDDFTLGTQARRWLDDDEYLVRRRIHRDLRSLMEKN